MSSRQIEEGLAVEAASQWGMFTAAQAIQLGMTRRRLTQLTTASRIHHTETRGVYRFAGAPVESSLDELRSTWLSLEPADFAGERLNALRQGHPDYIVSHLAAANYVYELGTRQPDHLDYTTEKARKTNNPLVAFHISQPFPPPWRLEGGLPTTTVPRTIADLYAYGLDGGHFGDVVRDALSRAAADLHAITAALDPLTDREGRDTVMHALSVVGAPDNIAEGNEILFASRR